MPALGKVFECLTAQKEVNMLAGPVSRAAPLPKCDNAIQGLMQRMHNILGRFACEQVDTAAVGSHGVCRGHKKSRKSPASCRGSDSLSPQWVSLDGSSGTRSIHTLSSNLPRKDTADVRLYPSPRPDTRVRGPGCACVMPAKCAVKHRCPNVFWAALRRHDCFAS